MLKMLVTGNVPREGAASCMPGPFVACDTLGVSK